MARGSMKLGVPSSSCMVASTWVEPAGAQGIGACERRSGIHTPSGSPIDSDRPVRSSLSSPQMSSDWVEEGKRTLPSQTFFSASRGICLPRRSPFMPTRRISIRGGAPTTDVPAEEEASVMDDAHKGKTCFLLYERKTILRNPLQIRICRVIFGARSICLQSASQRRGGKSAACRRSHGLTVARILS